MHNFKFHFQSLCQALPTIRKEMIEVLDIMLRWFVVQFCKSNTTSLLKVWYFLCLLVSYFYALYVYWILNNCISCVPQVLEFLHDLFDMFRDEGYMLTESEAAILLPCLMEKVVTFLLYAQLQYQIAVSAFYKSSNFYTTFEFQCWFYCCSLGIMDLEYEKKWRS